MFKLINPRIKNKYVNWALAATLITGTTTGVAYCSSGGDNGVPLYEYPVVKMIHNERLSYYDYDSVRRGFQVFREVCSSCHGLKLFSFRHLVNTTHTLEEAKAIAAEYEYDDDPNDEGVVLKRPGRYTDYWNDPFVNQEEAKARNNGAYPTDLSYYAYTHHELESYIFDILTAYHETPPAGVELMEGSYFNIYFPGTILAMPPPLSNGMVEYEDGTPATVTQMAKDVSTFLRWVVDPKMEERKRMGLKALVMIGLFLPFLFCTTRLTHNVIRYKRVSFDKVSWK